MSTAERPFWKTLVPHGAKEQRYEMLQEIATGGMATVYLGYRHGAGGFGRIVALKRALGGNAEAERMLAEEARLAGRLHHPNVVSIIDAESIDGGLLLVMEYVEGTSLAHLLSAGALEPTVAARILLDVCDGLQAVHAACDDDGNRLELVHRDISPQNVLVGIDGVARLADFGIATTRTSTRTTSHNARRGKPGYMAPEYVTSGLAATNSDIFSLGVILWEALTGRRLFPKAKNLEEVRRNHEAPVPPPSLMMASLGNDWDELVLRALGHHNEPRFPTATAFAKALERVTRGNAASRHEVAQLVESVAHETLWLRRRIIKERLRASLVDGREALISGVHELPTRPEFPERETAVLDTHAPTDAAEVTEIDAADAPGAFDASAEMSRFLPARSRWMKPALLVLGGAASAVALAAALLQ